jgi:hypothetical protein
MYRINNKILITCLALLITIIASTLIARAEELPPEPQIILLYSEISEQNIYATYLIQCSFEGDIVVDVSFVHGGSHRTVAQCGWRITTPGEISIGYLGVVATGERVGPLTVVAIGEPATTVNRLFLPLVAG